jgi:hypothetical protein
MTVKEIAAIVRRELRVARQDGLIPEDWEIKVRMTEKTVITAYVFFPDWIPEIDEEVGRVRTLVAETLGAYAKYKNDLVMYRMQANFVPKVFVAPVRLKDYFGF